MISPAKLSGGHSQDSSLLGKPLGKAFGAESEVIARAADACQKAVLEDAMMWLTARGAQAAEAAPDAL